MLPHEYGKTCSINSPVDDALTFATNQNWVNRAAASGCRLGVISPISVVLPAGGLCNFFNMANPVLEFIRHHNKIYKCRPTTSNIVKGATISIYSSIGNDGMRYVRDEEGRVVSMIHAGNVVIGDRVHVGPFSSIASATLEDESTLIGDDVQIGSGCQIGHNVVVGRRTLVIDGTVILGSTLIGHDCYLGGNCTIRGHLSIAHHTMIAMGAAVVKSIKEPGFIWAGVPAKKMKPWNGEW